METVHKTQLNIRVQGGDAELLASLKWIGVKFEDIILMLNLTLAWAIIFSLISVCKHRGTHTCRKDPRISPFPMYGLNSQP